MYHNTIIALILSVSFSSTAFAGNHDATQSVADSEIDTEVIDFSSEQDAKSRNAMRRAIVPTSDVTEIKYVEVDYARGKMFSRGGKSYTMVTVTHSPAPEQP